MKRISIALLLLGLFLVLLMPCAGAAPEEPGALWNISFIGDMKVPAGFSAVEVKDFRDFIAAEKKKPIVAKKPGDTAGKPSKPLPVPEGTPTLLKDALPADQDSAELRLRKADFALYHLTLDDGTAIHMAWFLVGRDGEKMPETIDIFSKELTPGDTKKLEELKVWIDANIDKAQYTDPKNKVKMKLLEVLPIQVTPSSGGQMWTAGARALVTVDDMPFAFFGRAFALSLDGHLTVGVLAGFDSERPFWDPIISGALGSLPAKP